MKILNRLALIFFAFFLIVAGGCIPATVDTTQERERLSELFVGNALPIVELNTLTAEKVLVPSSRNKAYSIDNRVGIEGEYYIFNIYTPHGTVTAKGVAALVEYCYDAEVLEMLLSSSFGEVIDINIDETTELYNNEAVDAKIYRVDSIAGIGRRFNQVYSEDFDRDVILDNIVDRNAVFGMYYDPRRMELAYRLGLDAYSANPYVQLFLNSLNTLGEGELSGILSTGLVQPEVNIHRGRKNIDATLQSRYLFPGSRSLLIESRMINSDPVSVQTKLYQLYQMLFPNTSDNDYSIRNLIYSSRYSIREELYIFAYLNDMKGVKNKKDIVSLMSKARSAFEAKQYYLQLQLLHAYYAAAGGLDRFVALSNMIGAVDNSSRLIVIPTWDHTREREEVRKLLVEVRNLRDKTGAASANIWFVGDCDKNTKATAKKIGINVRDGVAAESMFRFTNYRKLTYEFLPGDPLVQNAVKLTPDPVTQYQRVNRPVPTVLLPDSENPAKTSVQSETSIIIEDPDKPKPKKHDPRNWREFGIGVKVIPKEDLESGVPGISEDGIGEELGGDETGSGDGRLPPVGDDPVKVGGDSVF